MGKWARLRLRIRRWRNSVRDAWLMRRIPDSWTHEPPLPGGTVWREFTDLYGHHQRISVQPLMHDSSIAWVTIQTWIPNKLDMLGAHPHLRRPQQAMFLCDDLAEACREILDALEPDEPAIDQSRYVEPWPEVR